MVCPFSDPSVDGVVIQRALRQRGKGISLRNVLQVVSGFQKNQYHHASDVQWAI